MKLVCVYTGVSAVRTLGQAYSSWQILPGGAYRPPTPMATSASYAMAVRVPSRMAARVMRWIVPDRWPASDCSATRSHTQRTGARILRDSAAAM